MESNDSRWWRGPTDGFEVTVRVSVPRQVRDPYDSGFTGDAPPTLPQLSGLVELALKQHLMLPLPGPFDIVVTSARLLGADS